MYVPREGVCVRVGGCAGALACACAGACVALFTQHAKRMRRIILSSVASLTPSYFSSLSHKRYDFRKIVFERKMCVLTFYTIFISNFLILRIIQRGIVINVKTSSRKVPIILVIL